jgi:hypothetical protein
MSEDYKKGFEEGVKDALKGNPSRRAWPMNLVDIFPSTKSEEEWKRGYEKGYEMGKKAKEEKR